MVVDAHRRGFGGARLLGVCQPGFGFGPFYLHPFLK